MAIARIKATPRWFRAAARRVEGEPKIKRELLNAAESRLLMAAFTGEDMRRFAAQLPDDPNVVRAMAELEAAEQDDLIRRANLHALTDRWRNEASW